MDGSACNPCKWKRGASKPAEVRMKSSRRETAKLRQFDCPLFGCQKIVSGKYKLRILWDLQHGPLRYGEIRHGC